MKASAIIKRKTVRYEESEEETGEKSKHQSQKSAIVEFEDIYTDNSRVVPPTEHRWSKFFRPGETSLTENELMKRKAKKFSNHRFYLQLSTLCDRIKIIQGELTEDQ